MGHTLGLERRCNRLEGEAALSQLRDAIGELARSGLPPTRASKTAESHEQNTVVMQIVADAAARYAGAG